MPEAFIKINPSQVIVRCLLCSILRIVNSEQCSQSPQDKEHPFPAAGYQASTRTQTLDQRYPFPHQRRQYQPHDLGITVDPETVHFH
jgi:hypothetical protein